MHKMWHEEASRVKACVKARLLGEPELAPRIGRFRLVRQLGQGATGIVYEAEDTASGEMVALKLLRTSHALGRYRFKREFRALCGVVHENLVQLYELFVEREQWCFTMELVRGADFEAHVRGHAPAGTTSESPPLRPVLIQLIKGVQAIHAAGKLHCDLKPSNVRVAQEGRVVLLDFGLMIAETGADGAEETGHVFDPRGGTPGYIAPEVAMGAVPTCASDAYSIGVMLFQALTGALPLADVGAHTLEQQRSPRATRPSDVADAIPEDLDALCADLLERDPSRRCSLESALERLGVPREPAEVSRPLRPSALSRLSEPGAIRSQRLVGRDAELARLHAVLEAAQSGRSIFLLVRGPSGIGKSALVESFVARLPHGTVVLRGRCYERESTPFKAFDEIVDALARYLKTRPQDELHQLAPLHAQALFRVFPTLGQVAEFDRQLEQGAPASAHEWRQRAFGALKELLRNLAQGQPLVIFADDLQWADLDSARLLAELLGPPAAPVLLYVGCHRSEDENSSVFLQEIKGNDCATGAHERHVLTLGPIEPSAAEQMALQLLRNRLPDAELAAQRVSAAASGVPFAVRELSRYLASELASDDGTLSLAGVLKHRIATLPANARLTLSLLALAKGPLPVGILRHAFGGEPNWQRGLRTLQVAGFVRGDALGSFAIDHDRVREQITVLLSGAEHTDLHRVLAEACEQVEHVEPEWLVEHWRGAGDAMRALSYALSAAELSAQKLAFNRAAELYRLALQLLDREDRRYGPLQQELGDALANAGRSPEAAEAFLAAAALADRELEFSLHCRALQQCLRGGEITTGARLARELFARVGLGWPESRSAILLALARAQALVALRSFRRTGVESTRDGAGRTPPTAATIGQTARSSTAMATVDARLQVLGATFREYAVTDPLRGMLLQSQLHAEALHADDEQALFAGRAWYAYNLAALRGTRGLRGNAERIAVLQAMAARLQSPYVLGGSASVKLIAEVDAALHAQGVAEPARWVEMYVPGFAHVIGPMRAR
jgi:serine/threonine protein kinase/tetratricopeptide (TPR) repeat protein